VQANDVSEAIALQNSICWLTRCVSARAGEPPVARCACMCASGAQNNSFER
jgi:hypothetical protein